MRIFPLKIHFNVKLNNETFVCWIELDVTKFKYIFISNQLRCRFTFSSYADIKFMTRRCRSIWGAVAWSDQTLFVHIFGLEFSNVLIKSLTMLYIIHQ